jgi:Flp pilus assembly protein TadG
LKALSSLKTTERLLHLSNATHPADGCGYRGPGGGHEPYRPSLFPEYDVGLPREPEFGLLGVGRQNDHPQRELEFQYLGMHWRRARRASPQDHRARRVMPYRQLLVPRWLPHGRGWRHLGSAGSVAVELALTAPILVTLAVGIADLGNLFNFSQALEAATRIGAEYALRGSSCQQDWGPATAPGGACTSDIQSAVTNSLAFSPALATRTVELACECASTATPSTYMATPCGTSCFTSPPAGGYTGPNRVFIKVGATQPFSEMIPWPVMPTTLAAVTTVRVQ